MQYANSTIWMGILSSEKLKRMRSSTWFPKVRYPRNPMRQKRIMAKVMVTLRTLLKWSGYFIECRILKNTPIPSKVKIKTPIDLPIFVKLNCLTSASPWSLRVIRQLVPTTASERRVIIFANKLTNFSLLISLMNISGMRKETDMHTESVLDSQ